MKSTLLSLLVFMILQSCTIEKRHYTKGFNVEWKNSRTNKFKNTNAESKEHQDDLSAKACSNIQTSIEILEENEFQDSLVNYCTLVFSDITDNELKKHVDFDKKTQSPNRKISRSSPFKIHKCDFDFGKLPDTAKPKAINKKARQSLAFGILTWAITITFLIYAFSFGSILIELFILEEIIKVITAIFAIAKGKAAKNEMILSPDAYSNKASATIGKVLGIVHLALLAFAFLMILASLGF